MAVTLDQVVFTGFNSRVIALNRDSGEILWDWKCPTGSGYVSLLLMDDAHLIVSVNGYTYCLDPTSGAQMWFNELKGFGSGVAALAALGVGSSSITPMQAAAQQAEQAAAASAASAST